jgi:hypothetical protein
MCPLRCFDVGGVGEFVAAVWASGDAVSRGECVAEAVTGVSGVADVVDVVGDAVGVVADTVAGATAGMPGGFRRRGEQQRRLGWGCLG